MAGSNQQSAYATTCEAANTRTQQKRTTRKNKKVNKKHKKRNLRKTKICVYSADRLTQSISKQNADNLARQVGGARTSWQQATKERKNSKALPTCRRFGANNWKLYSFGENLTNQGSNGTGLYTYCIYVHILCERAYNSYPKWRDVIRVELFDLQTTCAMLEIDIAELECTYVVDVYTKYIVYMCMHTQICLAGNHK